MMKKLIFILLILSLMVMSFACKAKISKSYEGNKYAIEMNIDEDITVKQALHFTNTMKENLDEIKFNLYANAYREDASIKSYKDVLFKYGGIDISVINIGAEEATYNYNEDKSILTVKTLPLKMEEKIVIDMEYTVIVPSGNLRFGKSANTTNLGNIYPVLAVYENNKWREDAYSRIGDPFYSATANYEVTMIAKKEVQIACTGDIKSNTLDGEYRKVVSEASNVRDFALVISEKFKVMNKVAGDTTVYYYYIIDPSPQQTLQTAVDALTLFGGAFGKYPYKSYSVVETDFLYGGMEYPNLVYISTSCDDREEVVVHETAHQWWYGLVGNDNINESFIDEGLATFSTSYYYLLKGDEKKFVKEQETIRTNYQKYIKLKSLTLPDYIPKMNLSLNEYTVNEYNMMCYDKSSMMFKSIFDMTSRKKFENSLKILVDENKYGIAKRADLYLAFNKGCGTDVGKIFDAWIDGTIQTFSFTY